MPYAALVIINNGFLREGSPLMNGDDSSPPILSLANIIFDLSFKCLKPRGKYDMALLATVAGRSFIRFFSDCLDPPLLILVACIS